MRLVVLSSRRLLGESLAAALKTNPEVTTVNRVAEPESLLSLCELFPFDAAVIDANRDAAAVAPLCRVMRDRFPAIYLVVMYEQIDPADLATLRANGVRALVPCARGLTALLATLRERPTGVLWPQPSGLSGRQRDVLMLLGSGHSVIETAELLGISPGTVENHKRRLYTKLAAATGVHAVARAIALGIIDEGLAGGLPDGRPADNGRRAQLPARRPEGEDGRPLVVLVHGNSEPVLQAAQQVLLRHGVPVAREALLRTGRSAHWWRWHRGPVVMLLVDPGPADWRAAGTLHRPVVAVYSSAAEPAEVSKALANGAAATLTADRVDDRLVHLLNVVARGYLVVGRDQARPLLHRPDGPAGGHPSSDITAREHDILRSIAKGHTIRETAGALGIAVKTVANAQSQLFRKLGVHNRASALVAAHSFGLLPDPPAQSRVEANRSRRPVAAGPPAAAWCGAT